jgi:hypothetical protein
VPEVSRFFGIVVAIFSREHLPPHFHAVWGSSQIRVGILTGEILSGGFPRTQERLVLAWWRLHRDELLDDWRLAQEHRPLRRIDPLE